MSERRAFGCLFCITGKEQVVAGHLQRMCPDVRAVAARQEKHRTVNGKKLKVEEVFLPSYVFFEAPESIVPTAEFPREHVIRILALENGIWQLTGNDASFARWLFDYNGLLSFSKAYREGERIRIVSGPLKDMEGMIRRVDKRGRSGQVILEFNGRSVPVWLGFDLLDAAPAKTDHLNQMGDQDETSSP